MKSILEELYFGNLDPNKGIAGCKAIVKISEIENTLTELLEGKEKRLFLKFIDACDELNGIISVEKFVCGFAIGASMITEVHSVLDIYCHSEIA